MLGSQNNRMQFIFCNFLIFFKRFFVYLAFSQIFFLACFNAQSVEYSPLFQRNNTAHYNQAICRDVLLPYFISFVSSSVFASVVFSFHKPPLPPSVRNLNKNKSKGTEEDPFSVGGMPRAPI